MYPQRTRSSLHELCQVRPDVATPAHAKEHSTVCLCGSAVWLDVTASVCLDSDQIIHWTPYPPYGFRPRQQEDHHAP